MRLVRWDGAYGEAVSEGLKGRERGKKQRVGRRWRIGGHILIWECLSSISKAAQAKRTGILGRIIHSTGVSSFVFI